MNPIDGLFFAFGEEILKAIGRVFRFVFGPSNATIWERFSHFTKALVKIFFTLLIIFTIALMAMFSRSK